MIRRGVGADPDQDRRPARRERVARAVGRLARGRHHDGVRALGVDQPAPLCRLPGRPPHLGRHAGHERQPAAGHGPTPRLRDGRPRHALGQHAHRHAAPAERARQRRAVRVGLPARDDRQPLGGAPLAQLAGEVERPVAGVARADHADGLPVEQAEVAGAVQDGRGQRPERPQTPGVLGVGAADDPQPAPLPRLDGERQPGPALQQRLGTVGLHQIRRHVEPVRQQVRRPGALAPQPRRDDVVLVERQRTRAAALAEPPAEQERGLGVRREGGRGHGHGGISGSAPPYDVPSPRGRGPVRGQRSYGRPRRRRRPNPSP